MSNQEQIEQIESPFARRLKAERQKRGWSQAKVAEALDIETKTVWRWERSDSLPAPYLREKLCVIFNISLAALGLSDGAEETEAEADPPVPAFLFDPTIPLTPSRLIGRSAQLRQLKQRLLSKKSVALSALNGLPGVGKTALSIALAHDPELHQHFRGGVLWAGLGPSPNIQGHLSRWGSQLGISSREMSTIHGAAAWSLALRQAIGQRSLLLVIDDAWGTEDALAFKVGGINCAHVITTRFPALATRLAPDGAMTIHELSNEDGLALLRLLAPQVVNNEPELAQELAQVAGGLPLALVLMGNYLRSEAYAGQTRRAVTALTQLKDASIRLNLQEPRAPIERHPSQPNDSSVSLRSIIAVTDHLLSENARAAFYALSAFPAKPVSFSEEAALAVAECDLLALDQLTDAGLLENNGTDHYTLHQAIADYTRLQAHDSSAQERLIAYVLCFTQAHRKDYELLEREELIIFHAMETARALSEHLAFIDLVLSSSPFLMARGLYDFAEAQLEHARTLSLKHSDEHRLTQVLFYRGQAEQKRRHYHQALDVFVEGLGLARLIADHERICAYLASIGWVLWQQGELIEAERHLEEGLVLARRFGHCESACASLRVLGSVAHSRGDYEQAETLLLEAITLAMEIGDREQQCVLLIDLGVTQATHGKYNPAEQTYQEALRIARQINHTEWIILALLNMGDLLMTTRRYPLAKDVSLEGLVLARQTQQQEWLAGLAINLGVILHKLGEADESEVYFREGFAILRQLQRPEFLALCIHEYGNIALEQGNLVGAEDAFQEMLTLAPEKGKDLLMLAWYGLARVSAAHGEMEDAREQGLICLQAMEESGHRLTQEVRAWLSTLAKGEGQSNGIEKAQEET